MTSFFGMLSGVRKSISYKIFLSKPIALCSDIGGIGWKRPECAAYAGFMPGELTGDGVMLEDSSVELGRRRVMRR